MDVSGLGRTDAWEGVRAAVAGFGVSGAAAADNLIFLGAHVTTLDERTEIDTDRAQLLETLGGTFHLGPGSTATLPDDIDVLIASPGWRPDAPLLQQARARGIPIWGEVELAWRLRDPEHAAPWLAVTGTNGKTTTVQMLDAILRTAGLRSTAVGNVGRPIVEAVMDPTPYDVFAVELSSFQLHHTHSMRAESAAVLNLAEDHLDWYDGPDAMGAYAADKARIYHQVSQACVYNVEDPATEQMVMDADVVEGARAIGFTLGMPGPSMLGIVEDILVDRAFIPNRATTAAELLTVGQLASDAPHFVANALAAAALARSFGVSPASVADGLRTFRPDGHRIEKVAVRRGLTWVDDSKATNPHAALSSLRAHDSVVWIAGGLAKGASFDDLVRTAKDRLRGVVLIGADRDVVADALSRHAPDVPVQVLEPGETGTDELMDRVVAAAAALAVPGDTVLLAPGCASMDLFANYGERGDKFAEAVRRLAE